MGFLARVHSTEQRAQWTGPLSWSDHDIIKKLQPNAKTIAGVPVTEQTAFTFSAVYDAVNQLSSDLAKVPLTPKKRLPGGGSDDNTNSRLYKLLKFAPNPEQNPFVFRRTLVAYALTWHGGFAEIVRNSMGEPTALFALEPWRVRVTRERGRLEYRVSNASGDPTFLSPRDVLHLQGLGDGVNAYPLIGLARQAIGLALAAEAFGATFFGNGLQFGGILSSDQNWDEETAKQAKKVLEDMYVGPDAAHQLVALWGGLKLQMTGVDPQKAEMNDLRNQQIQEVARFFNMPLHKLKLAIPGAVSYASVEMADLDYYKGPILTWGKQIEDECNLKLISPLEQTQQFVKHNFNAFLRGDIKSRYDALGIARDKGIINADEWRELEDMNPQAGGQGQLYLVQSAQVPLGMLKELTQSQIDKNAAPPPAPPAPDGGTDAASEAVRVLEDRLALADAAVAEQRELVKAALARIEQLASDLFVTQAQRDALTADVEKELRLSGHLEAIQSSIAVELTQLREAAARAGAARAQIEADMAVVARDTAVVIQTRTDERDAALRSVEEAQAKIAALETRAVEVVVDKDAMIAAATDDLRAITERADMAAQEAARLADAIKETERRATEAEALAEQRASEVEAATRVAAARAEELADARDALRAATERADISTQEAARLEEAVTNAERRTTEAEEARNSANAALSAAKTVETARDAAIGAALRGVIVKELSRKIWRECDRLRRAHASPAKLRTAIGLFYDAHQSETAEALAVPVRGYLTWLRSESDPGAVVEAIAAAYIAGSRRDLEAVLAADPVEDLPAVLERCLERWQRDRPEALTDEILRLAAGQQGAS